MKLGNEKKKSIFSDPLTQVINAVMVKKGENSTLQIRTLADLNHPNVKMGVPSGTAFDLISQKHYPQAEVFYLNGFCDVIPALRQKIVDAALFDEPVARDICRQNRDLTYIRENVESVYFALGFSKTERGVKLCSQINEFLNKLKENGTLADIEKLWVDGEESQKKIDKTGLSGKNGTLRLLTPSNYAPFTYVQDGEVVGYEMDLLYRFAREYGYQIEILVMEPSAVISGLVAGKGDLICGGVSYTAERAEKILFSVPTYETGIVALVRASTIPEENGLFLTDEKSTWHSNLSESFERTFVRESRWKLVLDGIRITIFISIFSAIFGTLLGFGICLLRRSGNRLVNIIALSYIRVMQGTPMIVLLMILFYIVFAKTGLDGVWVAVIGFGLNFAAYVSEMMRTGIESVDKGQMEAALALGYRKPHAFLKIVLPQAARHFLPVYQGEFISLVKMTSVVGYIAIQDLTKASDIIRSRTYEAFFPLISTAIIYFIIAWLLTRALVALQDRLNPKKRRKRLFSK
ncbi:MAG: ABC transporter permease subunit [Fibrobacter sp.]|nr:ABC transporter permease subunit [Fibrobacter sp.]